MSDEFTLMLYRAEIRDLTATKEALDAALVAERAETERLRAALRRLWETAPNPDFVLTAALEAEADPRSMIHVADGDYRDALEEARTLSSPLHATREAK